MKVITILNEKGGVGKTSATINLGFLAAQAGFKTLLIDLDNQSDLSSIFQPNYAELRPSMSEFFSQRDFNLSKCINQAEINGVLVDNLDIAHSNSSISNAVANIPVRGASLPKVLAHGLSKVNDVVKYDYVFIDCPPESNDGIVNAITVADTVLVPVEMAGFADSAIQTVLELITDSKGYMTLGDTLANEDIVFVRNKYDLRNSALNAQIEKDIGAIGDYLAKTKLRTSSAASKSIAMKMPLALYEKNNGLVRDYKQLLNEVM
jgi:chromosome partitioning protein